MIRDIDYDWYQCRLTWADTIYDLKIQAAATRRHPSPTVTITYQGEWETTPTGLEDALDRANRLIQDEFGDRFDPTRITLTACEYSRHSLEAWYGTRKTTPIDIDDIEKDPWAATRDDGEGTEL